MSGFYDVIVAELRDDPAGIGYERMTPNQILDALESRKHRVAVKRYASLRDIACILSESEYDVFYSALVQAAEKSLKVRHLIEFLRMPCDESGTNGGLDFGNESVRQLMLSLHGVPRDTIEKVLSLGETVVSRREFLGLPRLELANVISALRMIRR